MERETKTKGIFVSAFLEEIFARKFVMIMGKGGVGKSTVAATLARLAVRAGKRVWLVENSHTESLAPIFGRKSVGPEEVEVESGLTLTNLNVKRCFENYVLQTLKSKMLFNLVFNNRLVELFVEALPGFDEILYLTEMLNATDKAYRGKSRKLYDLVIFDSAATGHGINVLKTALTLMDMVKQGPVHNMSAAVHKKLIDNQHSIFVPVTLAEEMPISETIEMQAAVAEHMQVHWSPIIVNAVCHSNLSLQDLENLESHWSELESQSAVPTDSTSKDSLSQLQIALRAQSELSTAHAKALKELHTRTESPVVVVPRIGTVGHTDLKKQDQGIEELACHLKNF